MHIVAAEIQSLEPRILMSVDTVGLENMVMTVEPGVNPNPAPVLGDRPSNFQAGDVNRWSSTTTNGGGLTQGTPTTLTWSLPADGVLTDAGGGAITPGAANNLRAFMDTNFGAGGGGADLTQRPWFPIFQQSLDRLGATSGLTYVYLAADDGTQMNGNPGIANVRADVRIMGKNVDGSAGSNILAYNYFPNFGDMIIDTSNTAFFAQPGNNFRAMRNVLMHEFGHGVGIDHVIADDSNALMEPFIDTSFDGVQLDDILALQRLYGDAKEKLNSGVGGNTFGTAIDLGTIAPGSAASVGTLGDATVVAGNATDFVSIDDEADIDFYKFTVNAAGAVSLTLTPRGTTYTQAAQPDEGQPANPQVAFNAKSQSDLTLTLFDTNGTTVLQTANLTGLGANEVITSFNLSNPGTYFARVTGATTNKVQLYGLNISAGAVTGGQLSGTVFNDVDRDGVQDADDTGRSNVRVFLDANNSGTFDKRGDNFAYAGAPVVIPDNGTVFETTLNVTGSGNITDLNVTIDLTHAFTEDMDIFLVSPGGTVVELTTDNDDIPNASGGFFNTRFDDEASTSIVDGASPFVGSFRPEGLLSALDGQTANGTWTLRITDDFNPDAGELFGWSIDVTTASSPDETSVMTNGSGAYSFTGLAAGDYAVRDVLESGRVRTLPSTGLHSVSLLTDQVVSGLNFGNLVNVTPVLGVPGTTAYTEQAAAVAINTGVTVADVDHATLSRATITVTGFVAGDVLSFTAVPATMGNIALTSNASGVMVLTSGGATATKAEWATALRAVKYNNTSDAPPASRTVTFVVNDGIGNSNTLSNTINITGVNDIPTVLGFDTLITYAEDGAAQLLDSDGTPITVTDPDSANFDTGTMTVSLSPVEAADTLGIRNEGTGAGQINLSGTSVRLGSTTIGTFTGGTNNVALVITFNASATPSAVQALTRNLTYRSTSENPSIVQRTAKIVLTDGDGGSRTATKKINVTASNDAPVLSSTVTTISYIENGATKAINPLITVVDPDHTKLPSATVRITNFVAGQDVLGFVANVATMGNIAATSNVNGLLTLTSAGTTATNAQWQAALRAVTYFNSSDNPTTTTRNVQFATTDGTAASNTFASTITITAVADAPTILNFGPAITFTEGGAALLIDTDVTVTDPDTADTGGGVLKVFTNVADGADRLAILHQGNGAGQIGVSGANVLFGNVVIGTFSGGVSTTPLTITLNAAARYASVQALLRRVTFRNTSTTPVTTARTLRVSYNNGLERIVSKTLNVVATIPQPVQNSGSSFGQPVATNQLVGGADPHTKRRSADQTPDNTADAAQRRANRRRRRGV